MTKILNKLLENIPETALESSVQSKLNSSGSGNPNQLVVTNETELIDAGTANKELLITADFSLTANRALQSNVKLIYAGGTINLAGFELTGNNTGFKVSPNDVLINTFTGTLAGTWKAPSYFTLDNFGAKSGGERYKDEFSITVGTNTVTSANGVFTSEIVGMEISIVGAGGSNEAHKSLVTGFTNSTTITIADNAVATATTANGAFGYNNKNALYQIFYVWNQSDATLSGLSKTYYHESVERTTLNANPPSNLWIKGKNQTLQNVDIYLYPHDLPTTNVLVLENCKNTTLRNILVHGDYDLHRSESAGKQEGNDGIVSRSQSDNTRFINVRALYHYTDGYYSTGDQQFSNYIDGANNVNGSTHTEVAVGSVSEVDGTTIDGADTTKFHTVTLIDVDTAAFDSQLVNGDTQRHYKVGGRSYAGWNGLKTPRYRAFYFAEDQTTLLYVSPIQYIYDEIPLEDEWKYVRLEFDEAESLADIQLMLAPHLTSTDFTWTGGEIAFNGRDGVSNPPDNSTFKDIYFHDNGEWSPGPGFDFNAEDKRRYCRNLSIINCKFRNSWGAISVIGCENVLIQGNTILPNTRDLSAAPTLEYHSGISVPLGYNVRVIGNTVWDRENTFGKGCNLSGNRWKGGLFTAMANGGQSTGDDFTNVYFKGGANADNNNRIGYPFLITKGEMHYNKQLGTRYLISDNQYQIAFDDNRWRFNSIRDLNAITTSYEHIFFGDNSENRLFVSTDGTLNYGGYFKNNHFFGGRPLVSARDISSGNAYFPLQDFDDNIIETNVEFNHDDVASYTVKNNHIKGWVEFLLDNYENTATGTLHTIRLEDWIIEVDDTYDWTNTGSNVLTTPSKYVSFEMIGGTLDLQQTSSQIGSANRYMDLNHLGTTLFDNVTWKSASAKTIDFTNTFIFPANLGAVTIIDPIIPDDNFTFTLRSQDKLLFTKAHKLMPVYADNATAIADGYPVGYMYRTATGEPRITI